MEWNADFYDHNHGFVARYGKDLLELLNPLMGEEILDAGCGTGDLAADIAGSGALVIAIDKSEDMIASAKNKYPNIDFRVHSVTDLPFLNQFDAVFSNAVLHWVPETEKAAAQIFKALKTGGRFVAEMGGKGNVAHIVEALVHSLRDHGHTDRAAEPVWYFPSIAAYASVLEKQGFRVTYAAHFDRETQLKGQEGISNWLRMFATPYLKDLEGGEVAEILQQTEKQLRATNYRNSNWYADYKRLRMVAVKEG